MSLTIIVIGVIALLVVIVLLVPVMQRANKVELTAPSDTKPEWMRDMPPAETVAKTLADGEGITVFDYEHGEKLAAPFAEQIEDILRAKIKADPALQKYEIDLATGANQALEIWVDGKPYASVDDLPDERLKEAFRSAVEKWNEK